MAKTANDHNESQEIRHVRLKRDMSSEGVGTSRLGVSLETHVKIWYQKLKSKLSYE